MTDSLAAAHIPVSDLALHALDGPRTAWPPECAGHLRDCEACRDRLAVYAQVAGTGRRSYPGETLVRPGPHVWDAIRSELRAERERTASGSAGHPSRPSGRVTGRPVRSFGAHRMTSGFVRSLGRLMAAATRFARPRR
jgi:hypothetical protein